MILIAIHFCESDKLEELQNALLPSTWTVRAGEGPEPAQQGTYIMCSTGFGVGAELAYRKLG